MRGVGEKRAIGLNRQVGAAGGGGGTEGVWSSHADVITVDGLDSDRVFADDFAAVPVGVDITGGIMIGGVPAPKVVKDRV